MKSQLEEDIYADVFEAMRMVFHSNDSIDSQSKRLVAKIMLHINGQLNRQPGERK